MLAKGELAIHSVISNNNNNPQKSAPDTFSKIIHAD